MERIHTYDESEINFHNVDTHASKVNKSHMASVSTLIDFFNVPIVEDKCKEIFLVREFLIWMNVMKTHATEGISEEIENLLKDHAANALVSLCKSANIQAEKIFGVGKNLKYIPGHTEEDEDGITKTAWVAFKSHERWHLVEPQRVLSSIKGHQRGGEILLESHGETVFEEKRESEGTRIIYADDFWFCLHPSIFISYCLPDDPEWQLLPTEQRKNMSDFLSCPFLYQYFFKASLQLLSEHICVLHAINGRCTITFGADRFDARYISMSYRLSLRSDTGNLKDIDVNDLPLLVRYAPGIGTFSFNIRFPVSGEYLFETYVSAPGIDVLTNCSLFKIICTEPDHDCKKLPLDAGIVGYGFGYTAVDFGLKNPSSAQPNIAMKSKQSEDDVAMKEITFQIEDDKIADVEFSSDVAGEENEDNVYTETRVDEVTGKLHVKAGMKTEGEYALSIIAREKNSDKLYKRIINYLLTTKFYEDDNADEFLRESIKRKKELTLQAKMQELNDKKAALDESIKAMQIEIDDLQKTYEENKNNKVTQTETILLSNVNDKETQTEAFQTVLVDNKEIQTDDAHTAIVNENQTQVEGELSVDTGRSSRGNEQTFVLRAVEKDGNIVIVASKSNGEQIPNTEAQTTSRKSKICTIL